LSVHNGQVVLDEEQWSVVDGKLRLSWSDIRGLTLEEGGELLTVKVQVKRAASLRDILAIDDNAIEPELYQEDNQIQRLGLSFAKDNETPILVYQNRPNPVHGETIIDYEIAENSAVKLQVHDVTGKLIYTDEADAVSGQNQFRLHTNQLQSGVLYYTISDGTHSATRKMVVIR